MKWREWQGLVKATLETRPDEITCQEWLDMVGRYADAVLAGEELPSELEAVARHMETCPECAQEFEALMESLKEERSQI